jgi:hypothetical protein
MKRIDNKAIAVGVILFLIGIFIGYLLGPNIRLDALPFSAPNPTQLRPPMAILPRLGVDTSA